MKALTFLIVLMIFPIVLGDECLREMTPNQIPCQIISSWKPTSCTGNLQVYNQSNVNIVNFTWGEYPPVCNATWNISQVGTYHYNSSIEDGVITINGDDDNMILGVLIFLFIINLVLFILPFTTNFSNSKAGNYVVKRGFWIASVFILWFNMTLVRQLSYNWGLGIDNFLRVLWWILTMISWGCIFILVYVALVGGIKLQKEAKMRKRMGEDE